MDPKELERLQLLFSIIRITNERAEKARIPYESEIAKLRGEIELVKMSLPTFELSKIDSIESLLAEMQRSSSNSTETEAKSIPNIRPARRSQLEKEVLDLLGTGEYNQEEICDKLEILNPEFYRSYFSKLFFKNRKLGRRPIKTGKTVTYKYATLEWYMRNPTSGVETYEDAVVKKTKRTKRNEGS